MRLYLSGPISGHLDCNEAAFNEAAAALRAKGHEVVVPHEVTKDMTSTDWTDFMRADIVAMMACEGIVMLPGWSESRGAKIEYRLAVDLGFEVMFL